MPPLTMQKAFAAVVQLASLDCSKRCFVDLFFDIPGYGAEAGSALASSQGIQKIGFTGSTATGTFVLKAAADNLIPATMELGGKSPNIFFSSIADKDDALLDKVRQLRPFLGDHVHPQLPPPPRRVTCSTSHPC